MTQYQRKPSAILLCCITALSLLSSCQTAQVRQETIEAANLKTAIHCMEIVEVNLDVDKFGDECIADGYIQHSQHVPDGKEGLLTYFHGRIEKFPEMRGDVKRAGADGDLVWLHMHFKAEPDSRGNAVIHIFKMKDGKFVEHWGVGQRVPETSVHGNSMF